MHAGFIMYKPPLNTNRVKSMKNKFENIENRPVESGVKLINVKNGARSNLSEDKAKLVVTRQLSDPLKRNIKRTPAFRVENSTEPTESFQRNHVNNRSALFDQKLKQFSALKSNTCDNNISNNINNNNNKTSDNKKPILYKSKSSHEFAYIRSKFDRGLGGATINDSIGNSTIKETNQRDCHIKTVPPKAPPEVSALYTEPIPKAQRGKTNPRNTQHITAPVPLSIATPSLDLTEISLVLPSSNNDIHNSNTLKLQDKTKPPLGITDTLKTALKRPLPPGPAPKKPPRTFQYNPENSPKPKADPKYMLSKLENALRNNRLRSRSKQRTPIKTGHSSTPSEEDSDDSVLFKSKSKSVAPTKKSSFNCLNLACGNVEEYERIKEPSSCFFVDRKEEPVYAEPFQFKEEMSRRSHTTRNSLYYMSSPVMDGSEELPQLTDNSKETKLSMKPPVDLSIVNMNSRNQNSAETSSLSSYTSDSSPSPMDERRMKDLIDSFENKPADRVETLKNQLEKTLNNSFRDERKQDNGQVTDIITKFQTYIRSVPKYCQPTTHKDSLFYCCLIIERVKNVSRIKFKYPPCVQVPKNIELLCFPEKDGAVQEGPNHCYSLSLTNDKGERTYGYCRRVLPEGSTTCLPLAYCILSKYKAPRFYKKILVELESRHGIREKCRDQLIEQFYKNKFPKPGESIRVNLEKLTEIKSSASVNCNRILLEEFVDVDNFLHVTNWGEYGCLNKPQFEKLATKKNQSDSSTRENNETELVLTLHQDVLYEDADLRRLHQLPADILLKIFSTLLIERKVILISSVISDLSCSIDSLQSLLYPFTWCHTFIPILPEALWDIVESPTPVVCGVLSKDVIENHKIENGIVVDIDANKILVDEGDEDKIMSSCMKKEWRKIMSYAETQSKTNDYVYSYFLRQAYQQVLRSCFRNCRDYIKEGHFQKVEFIKSIRKKGTRQFLKMFTETNIFLAFEDSMLTNPDCLKDLDGAENFEKGLNSLLR